MDTYIQTITAKLKLVFISPFVLLLCKLLLCFALVTNNLEKSLFLGIIFLRVIRINIMFFLNEHIKNEWTYKFYLQTDLIISGFLSDIGVPYVSQKQPPEVFYKKAVFKNFAIFTGKHLCWSLFLIKLQALWRGTLFKKRHQHRCFPINIAKFLRTPFWRTFANGCF